MMRIPLQQLQVLLSAGHLLVVARRSGSKEYPKATTVQIRKVRRARGAARRSSRSLNDPSALAL
jgi:hypothetical protein